MASLSIKRSFKNLIRKPWNSFRKSNKSTKSPASESNDIISNNSIVNIDYENDILKEPEPIINTNLLDEIFSPNNKNNFWSTTSEIINTAVEDDTSDNLSDDEIDATKELAKNNTMKHQINKSPLINSILKQSDNNEVNLTTFKGSKNKTESVSFRASAEKILKNHKLSTSKEISPKTSTVDDIEIFKEKLAKPSNPPPKPPEQFKNAKQTLIIDALHTSVTSEPREIEDFGQKKIDHIPTPPQQYRTSHNSIIFQIEEQEPQYPSPPATPTLATDKLIRTLLSKHKENETAQDEEGENIRPVTPPPDYDQHPLPTKLNQKLYEHTPKTLQVAVQIEDHEMMNETVEEFETNPLEYLRLYNDLVKSDIEIPELVKQIKNFDEASVRKEKNSLLKNRFGLSSENVYFKDFDVLY